MYLYFCLYFLKVCWWQARMAWWRHWGDQDCREKGMSWAGESLDPACDNFFAWFCIVFYHTMHENRSTFIPLPDPPAISCHRYFFGSLEPRRQLLPASKMSTRSARASATTLQLLPNWMGALTQQRLLVGNLWGDIQSNSTFFLLIWSRNWLTWYVSMNENIVSSVSIYFYLFLSFSISFNCFYLFYLSN